ncbi:MAG: LPS assembly lipoprotein LptE [Fibrobacterota bacterium]
MKAHKLLIAALICVGCGYYSFDGSSLPAHIKRVELRTLENGTSVPGVADELTDSLSARFRRQGVRITGRDDGDGRLWGEVMEYDRRADDYGGSWDDADIISYSVTVAAELNFVDITSGDTVFSGIIREQGLYNAVSEDEETGKMRALEKITQSLMNQISPGW